jgi:hypothetical protein
LDPGPPDAILTRPAGPADLSDDCISYAIALLVPAVEAALITQLKSVLTRRRDDQESCEVGAELRVRSDEKIDFPNGP